LTSRSRSRRTRVILADATEARERANTNATLQMDLVGAVPSVTDQEWPRVRSRLEALLARR
jgi:hypothetical protein